MLGDMRQGKAAPAEAEILFRRLIKMVVTRDERFFALAARYFSLADVVEIMQRMIGTGLIGGNIMQIASLPVRPAASVISPRAPGRTTKIGRSGPRPLATTSRPSPKTGVGAVIFEVKHGPYAPIAEADIAAWGKGRSAAGLNAWYAKAKVGDKM